LGGSLQRLATSSRTVLRNSVSLLRSLWKPLASLGLEISDERWRNWVDDSLRLSLSAIRAITSGVGSQLPNEHSQPVPAKRGAGETPDTEPMEERDDLPPVDENEAKLSLPVGEQQSMNGLVAAALLAFGSVIGVARRRLPRHPVRAWTKLDGAER
jgi:hypothetical protein